MEEKLSSLRIEAESHGTLGLGQIKENSENNEICDLKPKPLVNSRRLTSYINSLSNTQLIVTVHRKDFMRAAQNIKPSVTRSELDHYEALGREFNDLVT